MVVATCFQRLYGVVDCADFICEIVIRREATETEEFVLTIFSRLPFRVRVKVKLEQDAHLLYIQIIRAVFRNSIFMFVLVSRNSCS